MQSGLLAHGGDGVGPPPGGHAGDRGDLGGRRERYGGPGAEDSAGTPPSRTGDGDTRRARTPWDASTPRASARLPRGPTRQPRPLRGRRAPNRRSNSHYHRAGLSTVRERAAI